MSTATYAKGGGNYTALFTVSSTHASIGTTAVYENRFIEQTQMARQDTGEWNGTLTQLQDDPLIYAFLQTYAPVTESTGGSEVTLEDGTKIGGTTATSTDLLMLSYGPLINDGAEKRKLWAGIVKVAMTSGSYNQQHGEFSKPSFEVVSQKLLTDLEVANKFNTSYCLQSPLHTLTANTKGEVIFQVTS